LNIQHDAGRGAASGRGRVVLLTLLCAASATPLSEVTK